jgi:hypothetical protein
MDRAPKAIGNGLAGAPDVALNYDNFVPMTSLAISQYSTDDTDYITLPTTSLPVLVGGVTLHAGQSVSFRLTNNGEPPILGINDFSSTPVPTTLSLLGMDASFGLTRRLRSRLKAGPNPR